MIRFDQVHKRYANGREALAGVSFAIDDGEMAFLTGPSGAGKSSILMLLALIERPTRGQVFIGHQNTAGAADVQAVQIDTQWVARLAAILDILHRIILLTAALLGLGIVLVVGNTIRLDILNRRGEIEVLKLVGATDGFARRPFLYAGVWYGIGAAGGSSRRAIWQRVPFERLQFWHGHRRLGLFCWAWLARLLGCGEPTHQRYRTHLNFI
jgi:energy-coupling factor transporter ATP-binding protein EcfA2